MGQSQRQKPKSGRSPSPASAPPAACLVEFLLDNLQKQASLVSAFCTHTIIVTTIDTPSSMESNGVWGTGAATISRIHPCLSFSHHGTLSCRHKCLLRLFSISSKSWIIRWTGACFRESFAHLLLPLAKFVPQKGSVKTRWDFRLLDEAHQIMKHVCNLKSGKTWSGVWNTCKQTGVIGRWASIHRFPPFNPALLGQVMRCNQVGGDEEPQRPHLVWTELLEKT